MVIVFFLQKNVTVLLLSWGVKVTFGPTQWMKLAALYSTKDGKVTTTYHYHRIRVFV